VINVKNINGKCFLDSSKNFADATEGPLIHIPSLANMQQRKILLFSRFTAMELIKKYTSQLRVNGICA